MSDRNIMRGGRMMRILCALALIALPVAVAIALFALPQGAQMVAVPAGLSVSDNITSAQWAAAIAVGLVPLGVLMWTLWQMQHLFAHFERGVVLTRSVALLIRRIGQGFLALALIPLAVIPAQSVLLSWANPAGQRSLSVAVNSNMLGFAVVSGLLILIGWAMLQAAHVAAENESFV